MSEPPAPDLRLDLRVDPTATPIAGSLGPAACERVPFSGWIELTAALQDAVEAHRGRMGAER